MKDKNRYRSSTNLNGILSNVPCFVVGNSPSLLDVDIKILEPYFTLGINRAYKALAVSMLIWQDPEMMKDCRGELEGWDGICACTPKADPGNKFMHFNLKGSIFHKTSDASHLYGRGSTGPLAVQLAYAMGCRPIYLVGMDCCTRNGMTDFYGVNRDWKPHTIKLCQSGLNWIKNNFSEDEVINISSSPSEIVTATRKLTKFAQGRDFYIEHLKRRVLKPMS